MRQTTKTTNKQLPIYRASPDFFVKPIGLYETWRLAIFTKKHGSDILGRTKKLKWFFWICRSNFNVQLLVFLVFDQIKCLWLQPHNCFQFFDTNSLYFYNLNLDYFPRVLEGLKNFFSECLCNKRLCLFIRNTVSFVELITIHCRFLFILQSWVLNTHEGGLVPL